MGAIPGEKPHRSSPCAPCGQQAPRRRDYRKLYRDGRPGIAPFIGTAFPGGSSFEYHIEIDGSAGGPQREGRLLLMRKALAEFIGTALLLIAVVGSGIAAQTLSPNDTGLELLENAAATAAALMAIILAVGPVSGAHLNPVVTLADRLYGGARTAEAGVYLAAQAVGAVAGAVIANLMFSLPAIELSTRRRSSGGLWLGEVVATFGLLLVVFGVARSGRKGAAPFAVGAYIGG